MIEDIETILYHETTLLSRLDTMAAEITAAYRGKDTTVVALLNGSLIFMADLLRRIPLPMHIDCLSVQSYQGTTSSGSVNFRQTNLPDIRGRHVILLDDILDSGRTLHAVSTRLSQCGPKSLKTCVLLQKKVRRTKKITADYVGFTIPNAFVVGYGLDYNERYRNLPFIGILKASAIE